MWLKSACFGTNTSNWDLFFIHVLGATTMFRFRHLLHDTKGRSESALPKICPQIMAKQRISSADRLCFFFSYCARVHFLGSLIKQRRGFLSQQEVILFNMPWCYQICLAKCLNPYRDAPRTFDQTHCPIMPGVHFRLTRVAKKRPLIVYFCSFMKCAL